MGPQNVLPEMLMEFSSFSLAITDSEQKVGAPVIGKYL